LAGFIAFRLAARQKHHSGKAQWRKAAISSWQPGKGERERQRKRENFQDKIYCSKAQPQ
jgi:hypothetical protein